MKSIFDNNKENNRKNRLSKKSVLFSLDIIFAIILAGILITAIIFSQRSIGIDRWVENSITTIEMDFLTAFEKHSLLSDAAIWHDTSQIKTILNTETNENLCFSIKIYDSNSNLVATDTKTGCSVSQKKYLAKRSFIASGSFYYATMEGWYNEG